MIELLICDDNLVSVSRIKELIKKYFADVFNIVTATGSMDINWKNRIDVILMDIDLVRESGVDVACEITKYHPNAQVIFVSAYHEYAQDIFRAKPTYFIQKPIESDVFKMAIDRALENIEDNDDNFFYVERAHESLAIPIRDILYFESKLRRVRIITKTNEYEFYDKLDNVEERLSEKHEFIRCHQSYLVNPRYVTSMAVYEVVMENDIVLPVSKSRYQSSKVSYMKYLTSD